MICWGSWANTQKLSGKWRFELFYFDYSFGVVLCAVVAAFTFGSMNSEELTVFDMFALTGYRKMAWAIAGGVVFNLANILLVAAISLAGLAVAFPVGIGLALVIGVVWNYILNPQGNPVLLFCGAAIVVAAVIVDALAYKFHMANQAALRKAKAARESAAAVKPAAEEAAKYSRSSRAPRPAARGQNGMPIVTKGIIVSVISGILMGSFYPLVEMARSGEDGVRPYGDALLFSAGVFFSTFVFNFFFMMMPIHGEPVSPLDYFRGSLKQHALGVAGGVIWCMGAVSNFVASSTAAGVQVGPAVSYAMGQGATMVSALWGLLLWKEFAGATPQVKMLLTLMIVLFLTGLGMVSIAPQFVTP
jgi:glucose uptake protein